ncbi:MAG: hypothetical protein HGA30_07745 [Anaerolineales bacterium]|nr:hypothetical protein [Anaerolineales bacterium]
MKRLSFLFAAVLFLSSCGRLDMIPYSPAQTPETWLQIQPYAEFKVGSQNIILVQPSTSIIVYLLGVITIAVGVYFFRIRNGQRSRLWWGIALLLWGLGALLAGTSYEAFSYAIKCAGRDACLWTSWWEVIYLVLSVWSIDAMTLAVAYSSTSGRLHRGLVAYALVNAIAYFVVVMVGTFIPVKFLVSFELLLVVSAPGIVAFFIINGWRYSRYRQRSDLAYLGTWIWLGITIAAYFLYLISGNTSALWARGLWFSENDVLHIGLILWMLYIARVLAPRVTDLTA